MSTLADPRFRQFADLITQGADTLLRAGLLWCDILADNPRAYQDAATALPDVPRRVLESFERMGKRTLHPSLVINGSPATQRLALLPYEDQAGLLHAEVPVLVQQGGGFVERMKRVCDLSFKESSRVIGEQGIRPLSEQRALIRARKSRQVRARGLSEGFEPDGPVIEVEAEAVKPAEATEPGDTPEALDANPLDQLRAHLQNVNARLLEARSALIMVGRREHPLDRHITAALREVGQLRFAVNHGEL